MRPEVARDLVVGARHDGDFVQVTVRDRGHGIAPANMSQLFDSFFTTKSDGMGMGLSIARSMIFMHGGRIWAENTVDGGAAFHFTLAVAPARPARDRSRPAPRLWVQGPMSASGCIAVKMWASPGVRHEIHACIGRRTVCRNRRTRHRSNYRGAVEDAGRFHGPERVSRQGPGCRGPGQGRGVLLRLVQDEHRVRSGESAGHRGRAKAAPPPDQPTGARARGAVRGAAAGAVVGEIADDDAGKGAAYGAAAGVVAGGARNREAKRQQEAQANAANQQAQAQADQHNAEVAQQLANFKKGMSACLEGKGYVVK
jgi:hypothetical protein